MAALVINIDVATAEKVGYALCPSLRILLLNVTRQHFSATFHKVSPEASMEFT